jgi:hypothetical protein
MYLLELSLLHIGIANNAVTDDWMFAWSPMCAAARGAVMCTDATHLTSASFQHFEAKSEENMSRLSWTKRFYWRYLSKPATERALFLHVLENPVSSILELGLGNGDRFARVIPLCSKPDGVTQIRYAGVDLFESAPPGTPHLPLKTAHRKLAELGVKANLIPGDTIAAIARVANVVLPSDLVIVDGRWNSGDEISQAIQQWLPRLCHDHSTIFARNNDSETFVKQPVPATAVSSDSLRRAA